MGDGECRCANGDRSTARDDLALRVGDPAVVSKRDASRAKHTAAAYAHVGAVLEDLLAARATFVDTDHRDAERTADLVEAALSRPFFEPDARGPVWWLVEVTVELPDIPVFESLTREMLAEARLEDGTLTGASHGRAPRIPMCHNTAGTAASRSGTYVTATLRARNSEYRIFGTQSR